MTPTVADYIGSWVQPYPFVGGQVFPDNGLITTNYDKRVTQNQRLEIASKLLRQGVAFEKQPKIDGTFNYVWDSNFVANVEESLASGVVAGFSKAQKALFEAYIACALSGDFSQASDEVKALNTYLALEKK